ncbi:6-pyruvoyl trahydropterin synthase family protein [Fangia hongkongensis]|uniref:6-pyruvoyl trahydropterin synthase family protein n=2 Tax=Fangia hongkongensis TaxID=270495 RepID=UPI00146B569A|nr:6-carboxytetrahydropterin synthase [Fangia hongkongensis]
MHIKNNIILNSFMIYRVEKLIDGFSTCFRQWNANSHCRFLHGYAISLRLHFKAEVLDECNWVWDFGWLKDTRFTINNMTTRDWLHYMFDHTVVLSEKDPALEKFIQMDKDGLIQLRTVPFFSCEGIAKYVLDILHPLIDQASNQRASLYRIDVLENNKNMASAEL